VCVCVHACMDVCVCVCVREGGNVMSIIEKYYLFTMILVLHDASLFHVGRRHKGVHDMCWKFLESVCFML
jgi:hypothetical protein